MTIHNRPQATDSFLMTLPTSPFFLKKAGVSPNEYKVQGADEKLLETNAG